MIILCAPSVHHAVGGEVSDLVIVEDVVHEVAVSVRALPDGAIGVMEFHGSLIDEKREAVGVPEVLDAMDLRGEGEFLRVERTGDGVDFHRRHDPIFDEEDVFRGFAGDVAVVGISLGRLREFLRVGFDGLNEGLAGFGVGGDGDGSHQIEGHSLVGVCLHTA